MFGHLSRQVERQREIHPGASSGNIVPQSRPPMVSTSTAYRSTALDPIGLNAAGHLAACDQPRPDRSRSACDQRHINRPFDDRSRPRPLFAHER
jgi:hypothetical protein